MNDSIYKSTLTTINSAEIMYKHPLFPNFQYSDNVRYFIRECNSYWLLELILSTILHKIDDNEDFISVNVTVNDCKGCIVFDDGNENVLFIHQLKEVFFPLTTFKVWVIDKTMILPEEY